MQTSVLVVEHDAPDAASALHVWGTETRAAIIDLGLPDADGRDLCRTLRARGFAGPILFVSGRIAVIDRLAAFDAGGDDLVMEPVSFAEVVARLGVHLRHHGDAPASGAPALRLDPVAHAAATGDREVSLTPTEFRLLTTLSARAPRVVRRRELVLSAWPDGATVHGNTLDQHIARLRRRLRDLAPDARIQTSQGVGYRLVWLSSSDGSARRTAG